MNGDPEFDCAIVGGGILGAMAYHYARQAAPHSRHILFERNTVGCGSTGYSGGLMPVIGTTPAALSMAERSRELYRGLLAADPAAPVLRRDTYWILPAERRTDLETALGRALEVSDTVPASMREIYPDLRLPENHIIAFDDRVWVADPYRLTRSLLTHRAGYDGPDSMVVEGVEIVGIDREQGCLRLDRSDGRSTRVRRVIAAPGPWVVRGATGSWAGESGIRTKRTVCLHFRRTAPHPAPIVIFYEEQAFILPQPERHRILMNYTAEEWDVAPHIGEMHITEKDNSTALGILERFLPNMVDDYTGGQVFCDAYAPHRRPKVERVDALPGCVMLAGGSGSGVRFAPALAEQAIKLAYFTDGEVDSHGSAHFEKEIRT